MNTIKPYVTLSYFMRGDVSGKLQTQEFSTMREYIDWRSFMGTSVEVFYEQY